MTHMEITRRKFVVSTAAAGGGMMLGFYMPSALAARLSVNPWERPSDKDGQEVNAWLTIDPDGSVTVRVAQSEMGQGPFTAMPMIVCEELQCAWSQIKAEYADANRHVRSGGGRTGTYMRMSTGGSGAVRRSRVYLQQAGASARERLKAAAGQAWGVDASQVTAKDGILSSGNRSGTFAEFASAAAGITLAEEPAIKTPDQFQFLGASVARLDTPMKVNGTATYGIDVRLPGMVYAAVQASPVPYGDLVSYDFDAVKDRPGVIQAVEVKRDEIGGRAGKQSTIAIIADSWYRAKTALEMMPKVWNNNGHDSVNSEDVFAEAHAKSKLPGGEVVNEGDTTAALASAAQTITNTYQSNYTPHACMEPMNCTISAANGRVDVYVGAQNPPGALAAVAEEMGVDPENVYVHNAFLGGGFGRRSRNDETKQAAAIAAQVGRPVKMLWSREEDMIQGKHRPYSVGRFEGGLDANGNVTALKVTVAAHSLTAHTRPERIENGIDSGVLRGIRDTAYIVPNQYMDMHLVNTHIPLHYWRAVNATQNNWQLESFIDELAQAGGKDPIQLRKELTADEPQYQNLLTMLQEKSGFTTDLPKGMGMGVSLSEEFSTPVAHCATVSVSRRGQMTIDKFVTVVDCGHLVHPEMAAAQIESSIVYGLSYGWTGDMTIRNGVIQENNFDTFKVPRISQMPEVEVHFSLTRGDTWGGIGEPATPGATSAVANAIFYATGKRVTKLPLSHADLSWS